MRLTFYDAVPLFLSCPCESLSPARNRHLQSPDVALSSCRPMMPSKPHSWTSAGVCVFLWRELLTEWKSFAAAFQTVLCRYGLHRLMQQMNACSFVHVCCGKLFAAGYAENGAHIPDKDAEKINQATLLQANLACEAETRVCFLSILNRQRSP